MEGRQFVQGASQLVSGIGLLPVIINNSDHHLSSTLIISLVFSFGIGLVSMIIKKSDHFLFSLGL